jgi:hypothetical protein
VAPADRGALGGSQVLTPLGSSQSSGPTLRSRFAAISVAAMGFKGTVRQLTLRTPARHWLLTEPRFVIVGTGRSGTRYISHLLRAAGIRCGHENWWRLDDNQATRLEGDASWIATFQVDDFAGQVFHQIRDPLRVVSSFLYGKKQLLRGGPALDGRRRWVDLIGEDDVADALHITVEWLRKAEEVSEWTWRLEDVDALLLLDICHRIGKPIDPDRAQRAVDAVPTDTNRHVSIDRPSLSWDQLPDSELKRMAMTISRQYGYL